jgi:hypothetical protein
VRFHSETKGPVRFSFWNQEVCEVALWKQVVCEVSICDEAAREVSLWNQVVCEVSLSDQWALLLKGVQNRATIESYSSYFYVFRKMFLKSADLTGHTVKFRRVVYNKAFAKKR